MNLLEFLKQEKLNHKIEDVITISVYEKTNEEFKNYLNNILNKIKNISNINLRKKLNDSIYLLLQNIEVYEELNHLFFINENEIYKYEYTRKEIEKLKEYKLINPYYKTDINYQNEFFQDFFYNENFYIIISIDLNNVNIKKFTKTKEKNIKKQFKSEKDLEEIFKIHQNEIKNTIYYYSKKPINILNQYKLLLKNYNNNEFFDYLEKEKQLKNQEMLKIKLDELQNSKINTDLYVFGKLKDEFKYNIENYLLKELYIEKTKLNKLKTILNDESLFNFKIYEIESIEKNDVAENFIKNYNGLMGIKYY
jgi:hypothetical protein